MSLIKREKEKKDSTREATEMQHASQVQRRCNLENGVPMAHADGYQSLKRVSMPLLGKNSNGN